MRLKAKCLEKIDQLRKIMAIDLMKSDAGMKSKGGPEDSLVKATWNTKAWSQAPTKSLTHQAL